MVKRLFQKSLWLSGAAVFCLCWGFLVEPMQFKTRQHTINIDSWHKEPLKVVFLADIHFAGEHVSAERVTKIVEAINAQDPDLVLIGGDFIDGHKARSKTSKRFDQIVDDSFKAIAGLKAPKGVVAVIGNHDVWYNAHYVEQELVKAGIQVLKNSHIELGDDLCIVGYADDMTQTPLKEAAKGCDESPTVISLMHSPDTFALIERSDLALAGHTHGGQINIPFIGRRVTSTRLGEPFAYGLKDYDGVPVYVTSGIGTSVMPARFRSAPEIAVLTLQGHEPEQTLASR